ncbi:hypothetical protein M9Y10_007314 [Tritrichomonas musculus]|uniref:Protein kinase domain-containing protein n=1 Tax=Tritrichomonas musculus TaxID=1915356 RepID=A0ABR2J1E2_9EUKA
MPFKHLDTELIDELLSTKKRIGKGATSTTYRVKNCFTNKGSLCLKMLNGEYFTLSNEQDTNKSKNKSSWTEEEEQNNEEEEKPEFDIEMANKLYKEYELLHLLCHPNILTAYGFYLGDKTHNPAILLEFCMQNLSKAIKMFDDVDLVGVIYEICSAMEYLHEYNVFHRDLKMANILIKQNKHVKICDFGMSKVIDLTTLTSLTHNVGTIAFMAPELFREDQKYNEKVDVYSFGVVMYFIVTKGEEAPFTGTGSYASLKLPNSINKLSQSIIKKCWSNSPEERPSFSDILKTMTDNNFMLVDGIEDKIPNLLKHLGLK